MLRLVTLTLDNVLMIMDCAIYRKASADDVEGDLSDALDSAREIGDAFMWIGLHEPTTEEFDRSPASFSCTPWRSRTRSTPISARSWSATAKRSSWWSRL